MALNNALRNIQFFDTMIILTLITISVLNYIILISSSMYCKLPA